MNDPKQNDMKESMPNYNPNEMIYNDFTNWLETLLNASSGDNKGLIIEARGSDFDPNSLENQRIASQWADSLLAIAKSRNAATVFWYRDFLKLFLNWILSNHLLERIYLENILPTVGYMNLIHFSKIFIN